MRASPRTSEPGAAALVRRRTVAGTAALLAGLAGLAGCEWGPDRDATATDQREPEADERLAADARAALGAALTLVRAVASRHVGLATALQPLTALHQAHLALLGEPADPATALPSDGPAPTPLPRRAPAALTVVRTEETRLQTVLADLAQSASSGTFARALASMSAAVAQHTAALPEVSEGPA